MENEWRKPSLSQNDVIFAKKSAWKGLVRSCSPTKPSSKVRFDHSIWSTFAASGFLRLKSYCEFERGTFSFSYLSAG